MVPEEKISDTINYEVVIVYLNFTAMASLTLIT